MLADIWRAIRAYWRTSQFTLTAVVTMGLGIGANTAVFSFVSALLLRPMPYSDPERLVTIASVRGGERGKLMPREWEELNQDSLTFDGVAAWYPSQYNLTEGGAPEVVRACMTTANLFRVLGVGFAQGTSWQEGTHRWWTVICIIRMGAIATTTDAWFRARVHRRSCNLEHEFQSQLNLARVATGERICDSAEAGVAQDGHRGAENGPVEDVEEVGFKPKLGALS